MLNAIRNVGLPVEMSYKSSLYDQPILRSQNAPNSAIFVQKKPKFFKKINF